MIKTYAVISASHNFFSSNIKDFGQKIKKVNLGELKIPWGQTHFT